MRFDSSMLAAIVATASFSVCAQATDAPGTPPDAPPKKAAPNKTEPKKTEPKKAAPKKTDAPKKTEATKTDAPKKTNAPKKSAPKKDASSPGPIIEKGKVTEKGESPFTLTDKDGKPVATSPNAYDVSSATAPPPKKR